MVMDFGFLKNIMMEEIHDPCDHGLILYHRDRAVLDTLLGPEGQTVKFPPWLKLYLIDDVPTAEVLAHRWWNKCEVAIGRYLKFQYPDHPVWRDITLDAMIVHETPNSIATYRPNPALAYEKRKESLGE